MKCPDCEYEGKLDEFESDNLDEDMNINNENYIHVCPRCMYHFEKGESK